MKTYHPNKNLSKKFNYKRGKFWKLIIALSFATSFLSPQANAFPFGKKSGKAVCSKLHGGPQGQVLITGVGGGGLLKRALKILRPQTVKENWIEDSK